MRELRVEYFSAASRLFLAISKRAIDRRGAVKKGFGR